MTSPAVSIGMPVYNGTAYLADALGSILGQTLGDIEVIVSDNGSTDGTAELVRAVGGADRRLRLIEQPENRGAAWNYNTVFRHARAPLFKWAGHDDVLSPTLLAACRDALEAAGPAAVLAYPQTRIIDADGATVGRYDDRLVLDDATAVARLGRLVRNVHLANPIFGLIRRDVLAQTRLIGAYQGSDLVLLAELALRGRFVPADGAIFSRRLHGATSRAANTDPRSVAAWFDPRAGRRRAAGYPRVRLVAEHARAILHAELGPGRAAAGLALAGVATLAKSAERGARRVRSRTAGGELQARLSSDSD